MRQPTLSYVLSNHKVTSAYFNFFQGFQSTKRQDLQEEFEIASMADLTDLGVKEISIIKLNEVDFASVTEVMKFKDMLFLLFQNIQTVHEVSISQVTINGKSCNLQLL
jgi:hypothetical protein